MKEKLIALLKERGIEIAEEALVDFVELGFDTLELIVKETENKYDDSVYALFAQDLKEDCIKKVKELL